MKKSLTKREKILLYISSAFLIIYVMFQYVIAPLRSSYSEKLLEVEALTNEKQLLDIKLQNEELYRAGHSKAEAEYNEIKKRYPSILLNEEVDRIITGICLTSGLSPTQLGISGLSMYKPEGQEDNSASVLSVITATMNLRGYYTDIIKLINVVNEHNHVRITKITYSHRREYAYAYVYEGSPNITVLFEITMLNNS